MSLTLPTPIQLEAELLRRGIDPDLAVLIKQEYPGELPEFVTRTQFLALTMRMGYQRAVAIVQARLELQELERTLRAHRADGPIAPVLQAARVTEVAQQFQPTAQQTTRAAYLRGASQGVPALTRAGVQIRFDVMNPHAAQYAATASSTLITHINDSQRDAVRALIEGAVGTGRTVQETALDIRNVVGLRPDQVNALSKFRERLAGRDLTIDQVEKKVARYANALLKQRGELIARTEILTAANRGQLELWREARRDGKLDATWLKQWIVANDELLCEICEPMDDEPVGLNENFDSELGPVQHPPLHPQCRCTLGLVKAQPGEQRLVKPMTKDKDPGLYVYRDVLNAVEILKWASERGITNLLDASDLHVTVVYSKKAIPWVPLKDKISVTKDAWRTCQSLGDKGAVVGMFEAAQLQDRWKQACEAGATWDYPEYHPHVTFSYDSSVVPLVVPDCGIQLGPEKAEALDEEWADNL